MLKILRRYENFIDTLIKQIRATSLDIDLRKHAHVPFEIVLFGASISLIRADILQENKKGLTIKKSLYYSYVRYIIGKVAVDLSFENKFAPKRFVNV